MKITQQTPVRTDTFTELLDGLDYCLSVITNNEAFDLAHTRLEDRDYINQLIDLVDKIRAELKEDPKESV